MDPLRVAEDLGLYGKKNAKPSPILDFTAQPEIVKVLAEDERLSFGYLMNPTFATEISSKKANRLLKGIAESLQLK